MNAPRILATLVAIRPIALAASAALVVAALWPAPAPAQSTAPSRAKAAAPAGAPAKSRAAKDVVEASCSACHREGKKGAPKIGDKKAWTPRLSKGLDTLVLAGIRGHDDMPPRGGRADLTDAELRAAILYMFDPQAKPKKAP